MFGFGKKLTLEEKLSKIVKKGNWGLLSNYINKDVETQVALANACVNSKSSDCMNLVLRMLDQPSDEVKIAAINTLSIVGTDHETAALQQLLMKTPKENESLRNIISAAVQTMRNK